MQSPPQTSRFIQLLATLIQFSIVGLAGSIIPALLVALRYGLEVGGEIWFLGAVLVGSYFPLRFIISSRLHGTGLNFMPSVLNVPLLMLAAIGFMLTIPFLWLMTLLPMLVGLIMYAYFGQSVLLALLFALTLQVINVYRQVRDAPAPDLNIRFVTNFGDLSRQLRQDNFIIDGDALSRDEPDDTPDVIYHLPEQTSTPRTLQHDDEEIIIIDPDENHQQNQQD
jgi:hypothetical protein